MKQECLICGGTGQISYFKGVSRFLLSWEECPQCLGTGFVDREADDPGTKKKKGGGKSKKPGKKKKR